MNLRYFRQRRFLRSRRRLLQALTPESAVQVKEAFYGALDEHRVINDERGVRCACGRPATDPHVAEAVQAAVQAGEQQLDDAE